MCLGAKPIRARFCDIAFPTLSGGARRNTYGCTGRRHHHWPASTPLRHDTTVYAIEVIEGQGSPATGRELSIAARKNTFTLCDFLRRRSSAK